MVSLVAHAAADADITRSVRALLTDGHSAGWWRLAADGAVPESGLAVHVVSDPTAVDPAMPRALWVLSAGRWSPPRPGEVVATTSGASQDALPLGDPVVVAHEELNAPLLRTAFMLLEQVRVLRDVVLDEQARYDLLVEAADVGDWDMDIRRNRTRRSLRHDRLLGHQELLPQWGYDDFLAHVHPDDRNRVHAAYQRALAGEGRYDVEFRTTWPDGSTHWIASRGRFVLDASGAPLRAAGVMTDITERKLAELRLTEIAKQESVGRLAAGIAHDFNNQLTVILGTVSYLLDAPDVSADTRRELHGVQAAAEGSAQLIRGLLTLSRHVTGRVDVLELSSLLTELRGSIERLVGPGVDLRLDLPIGGLTVLADRTQLENMILNLAANARDAMPNGGGFAITGTVIGDRIVLKVSDTGVGMDAATLARCFEMFFTTKPVGRGTGLGLASVKRCVEGMRGSVEVQSAPGAGTTVVLRLPREPVTLNSAGSGPLPMPGAVANGRRVLLVDDEEAVRLIAARVLRGAGYEVIAASGGEEAVAHSIDSGHFDVLITDLIMPTMGGRAVAEAVRERHPETRVLLMSGYSDDDITQYGIDRGTYAFLSKPFTASMLLERVAGLLADAGAAGRTD